MIQILLGSKCLQHPNYTCADSTDDINVNNAYDDNLDEDL